MQQQFLANVSKFAAAKAFRITKKINSYSNEDEYEKRAKVVLNLAKKWQQTEVATATARARTAVNFAEYNEADNLRLFPNLQWLPSSAAEPREEHKRYYYRIWAKNDPFWTDNSPGNKFNCQCDMRQTAEPVTENANVPRVAPPPGLEGNPFYTGEIFTKNASYFRKTNEIANKEINKIVFKSHKNWAEENLKGKTIKLNELNKEINISKRGINEYLNQNHDNYYVKNETIRVIDKILLNADYQGYTFYKNRKSYIFKFMLLGKVNYIIANEQDDGIYLYGVSESNKVLIGIKK